MLHTDKKGNFFICIYEQCSFLLLRGVLFFNFFLFIYRALILLSKLLESWKFLKPESFFKENI